MPLARRRRFFALASIALLLAGCEMLGIESPERLAAQKDAEGKAVGSACRHALRAIEDCYALNPKAPKAAVFGGWREMDEYMRENKLEGVSPVLARLPLKSEADGDDDDAGKPAEKAAAKAAGHGAAKARAARPAARTS